MVMGVTSHLLLYKLLTCRQVHRGTLPRFPLSCALLSLPCSVLQPQAVGLPFSFQQQSRSLALLPLLVCDVKLHIPKHMGPFYFQGFTASHYWETSRGDGK